MRKVDANWEDFTVNQLTSNQIYIYVCEKNTKPGDCEGHFHPETNPQLPLSGSFLVL